jgi:hypothetical protein
VNDCTPSRTSTRRGCSRRLYIDRGGRLFALIHYIGKTLGLVRRHPGSRSETNRYRCKELGTGVGWTRRAFRKGWLGCGDTKGGMIKVVLVVGRRIVEQMAGDGERSGEWDA